MTKIGITGSRKGMSKKQKDFLAKFLAGSEPFELHHGDCVGTDEEAHDIADDIGASKIIVHPPSDDKLRAFCSIDGGLFILGTHNGTVVDTRQEKEYLDRNKDIVNESDFLLAFPNKEATHKGKGGRSGTWYTVRYARSVGKKVIVIYANGNKDVLDN
jgi:hypothetical protein